jgi:hypothetical protein
VMFPDGVRVACHLYPAGKDGGVLISADEVARRSATTIPIAPAATAPATVVA